jgi:hypothetical protein
MTLRRFLDLVAAYGQVSRFPDAERAAAEALLRVSEPARLALAEESELDATLAALETPELSPALSRKLNEIPLRTPVARRSRWPLRRLWAPALGWAAAAALGVVLGSQAAESDDGPFDPDTTTTEAATEQAASDEALAALALGSFSDLEETP